MGHDDDCLTVFVTKTEEKVMKFILGLGVQIS